MTAERHSAQLPLEPAVADARPVVPELIGLSLRQACQTAAWAGIRISAGRTVRQGPVGVVVAQSPPPGSRLQPRSSVHVLVAAATALGEPADA